LHPRLLDEHPYDSYDDAERDRDPPPQPNLMRVTRLHLSRVPPSGVRLFRICRRVQSVVIMRRCSPVRDEHDALGAGGGVVPGLLDVGERDGARVDLKGAVGDLPGEGGQFREDAAGAHQALAAADDI
jgi:hypothetical protein